MFKSHNRTERDPQGVGRDILIPKKLFLELCGQFPVTQLTSAEIVDFRKTRFHPKKMVAKVERCDFDMVKISCFSYERYYQSKWKELLLNWILSNQR